MNNYCEVCKKPIRDAYGSRRFCSFSCKQKFASLKAAESNKGKINHNAIKSKCKYCNLDFNSKKDLVEHLKHCEEKLKEKRIWDCPICGATFLSRQKMRDHKNDNHQSSLNQKRVHKDYDFKYVNGSCKFCKKTFLNKRLCDLTTHETHCYQNPNRKPYSMEGKILSDVERKQRSESMKKAHAEGKAYVWKHRITEPTWPEQWLINVLKNELGMECGKDYSREVPYNGFFLDFCWKDRKIVIEMDGEQHERLQEQIERDQRKDVLLAKDGYKELRIPWKLCFHNPKEWIQKIKETFGAL